MKSYTTKTEAKKEVRTLARQAGLLYREDTRTIKTMYLLVDYTSKAIVEQYLDFWMLYADFKAGKYKNTMKTVYNLSTDETYTFDKRLTDEDCLINCFLIQQMQVMQLHNEETRKKLNEKIRKGKKSLALDDFCILFGHNNVEA